MIIFQVQPKNALEAGLIYRYSTSHSPLIQKFGRISSSPLLIIRTITSIKYKITLSRSVIVNLP